MKNNPIKCTCKLKSDLSDESIKNKIADLKDIRCSNLNKTIEEAIKDVNCGMKLLQYNTTQYNTKQYNTIQYNAIQYNTIQYSLM